MGEFLLFEKRADLHEWFLKNAESSEGVWLVFSKKKAVKTVSAHEALEEALCFGWIDGQMKSIDETYYHKYFAQRLPNSKWSEKNKKLVQELDKKGLITEYGQKKIDEAKENGQWQKSNVIVVNEEDIQAIEELLKPYQQAYQNFMTMSNSVKKTYTKAYMQTKTEDGRVKRLSWMVDRLNQNLKPM
ncbi:hypothetical protein IGI37_001111 [Enterococcus sp. AZ194]|uniref:YdeI/OmpD-associated family protein n=1 Tax=Enterococcus sp. AZ194 TaxID=2774629 RepID=UPI003F23200F